MKHEEQVIITAEDKSPTELMDITIQIVKFLEPLNDDQRQRALRETMILMDINPKFL